MKSTLFAAALAVSVLALPGLAAADHLGAQAHSRVQALEIRVNGDEQVIRGLKAQIEAHEATIKTLETTLATQKAILDVLASKHGSDEPPPTPPGQPSVAAQMEALNNVLKVQAALIETLVKRLDAATATPAR